MESIECLVLKGTKGISEKEVFYIDYGQIVTLGRSRTCEISFKNFKKYQTLSKKEAKSGNLLSVSRKHLRIAFYNYQCVELKDLSTNGTFLWRLPAGRQKRIKKKIIPDIKEKSYKIRLGKQTTFQLAWGEREIK